MSTERWKAQVAITFLARNQSAVHLTESVTAGGFFVRTDAPPAPMTLVRFEVALPPDDDRLIMHGMVAGAGRSQDPHAVPGVDVTFFATSVDAQKRWERFIGFLRDKHPRSTERTVHFARESPQSARRHAFVDDFSAVDATPAGVFLATKQHIAVGTDVRVKIINRTTGEHKAVDGVVRRRVQGNECGIGVEYRSMTSDVWAELAAFLRKDDESQPLRAEVHAVWTPQVALSMQTLPGPWTNEVAALAVTTSSGWSPPPESGWFDPVEATDGAE